MADAETPFLDVHGAGEGVGARQRHGARPVLRQRSSARYLAARRDGPGAGLPCLAHLQPHVAREGEVLVGDLHVDAGGADVQQVAVDRDRAAGFSDADTRDPPFGIEVVGAAGFGESREIHDALVERGALAHPVVRVAPGVAAAGAAPVDAVRGGIPADVVDPYLRIRGRAVGAVAAGGDRPRPGVVIHLGAQHEELRAVRDARIGGPDRSVVVVEPVAARAPEEAVLVVAPARVAHFLAAAGGLVIGSVAVPVGVDVIAGGDVAAGAIVLAVLADVDLRAGPRHVADRVAHGGRLQPERRPHPALAGVVDAGLPVAEAFLEPALRGDHAGVVRAALGVRANVADAAGMGDRLPRVVGVASRPVEPVVELRGVPPAALVRPRQPVVRRRARRGGKSPQRARPQQGGPGDPPPGPARSAATLHPGRTMPSVTLFVQPAPPYRPSMRAAHRGRRPAANRARGTRSGPRESA